MFFLLSVHWPVSQAVQSDYGIQQCPCRPCSLRALPPLPTPAAEDCVHGLQQPPPPQPLMMPLSAAVPSWYEAQGLCRSWGSAGPGGHQGALALAHEAFGLDETGCRYSRPS